MISLAKRMSLQNRRALITGASGGLGRVMAETLAELGADLALVDLPNTNLDYFGGELAERYDVSVLSYTSDLEDENARLYLKASVMEHDDRLNILINNAAFVGTSSLSGWAAPFEEQSIETWRRALEINLTAGFHLAQLFAPALRVSASGSIVNIASIYGQYGPDWALYEGTGMANPAAYSASKGGLIQLTRWLATTLAPDIRVNAISPGGIGRNQPQTFTQRYTDRTPLARMAKEEDFVGAVAYLSGDLSAYVTGQVLSVDGGWGAW